MFVPTISAAAWVFSLPVPRRPASNALTSQRRVSRTPAPTAVRPRRARTQMNVEKGNRMQLVSVPDESHMPTPGEVRHVALDYALFQSILKSGSTTFGVINMQNWSTRRGCVLSILNIRNLLPDASPRVEVECRCSGRFDAAMDSEVPAAWTLLSADCSPVADWPVYDAADRQTLAEVEWKAWTGCQEVASLLRRVGKDDQSVGGRRIGVEQELAVWAPAEYDREISAEEWSATPLVTRHVWCERAESFSFGVLRCMEAEEDIMSRARGITSTVERLELGIECVEVKRARTRAVLSLKDAFS